MRFKAAWAKRKTIAHKIGDFQSQLLLSIFYFVVLGPFALSARIFSDPLKLGPKRINFSGRFIGEERDEEPQDWRMKSVKEIGKTFSRHETPIYTSHGR
jgi:hypothetical protein